jgi:hypothetical protein
MFWYTLTPVDVLLFRDAKPLHQENGLGQGVYFLPTDIPLPGQYEDCWERKRTFG